MDVCLVWRGVAAAWRRRSGKRRSRQQALARVQKQAKDACFLPAGCMLVIRPRLRCALGIGRVAHSRCLKTAFGAWRSRRRMLFAVYATQLHMRWRVGIAPCDTCALQRHALRRGMAEAGPARSAPSSSASGRVIDESQACSMSGAARHGTGKLGEQTARRGNVVCICYGI